MKVIDHSGQRFGRLAVEGRADFKINEQATWVCRCDCGNVRYVPGAQLRSGRSKSCGCLRSEITGDRRRTHGMSETPIYEAWRRMHDRCENQRASGFSDYGGRGIYVCAEWSDFRRFYADMGPRPSNRSLDRLNNDGPYALNNCRWATPEEQAQNRRPRVHKPKQS